ncbi:MAG: hypothetical protein NTY59_08060 [Alphaproteobacteria bacterium]|nr:hypothetical protein [Alphaproteobacteria bacterium]
MRALVLAFALLVAVVAPAAAADENPYRNRDYDKAPGPMLYPAAEEPEWLPRMLKKLQTPRSPRFLDEHLLFRDASGPTYLVTHWGAAATGEDFLEIHRIQKREGADPTARFVSGFSVGGIRILVPTGHDVFGDGVPVLLLYLAAGGSLVAEDGVRIIRLGDKPADITPRRYGDVTNVGLMPGDDTRMFLIAANFKNLVVYGVCGDCFITPRTFLIWREGRYVPACREAQGYFRTRMVGWRSNYGKVDREPSEFFAARLGWAWNAAQIGEAAAAAAEIKQAIAEGRQRGADWAGWDKERWLESEKYGDYITDIESNFLPALEKARRLSKAACPLTAALGDDPSGPGLQTLPILRTPLHDVK